MDDSITLKEKTKTLNETAIDSWSEIFVSGVIPTGRHCTSTVVFRDHMYIFGGYSHESSRGHHRNDTFEYNFSSHKWRLVYSKGAIPEARHSHSAILHHHHMLVFGGIADAGRLLNDVALLNLESFEWSLKECTGEIPSGRWGHNVACINNVMYVFGGYSNTYTNDLYALDLSTFVWSRVKEAGSIPKPRQFAAMVGYDKSLYLMGGFAKRNFLELCVFNTVTKKWSLESQDTIWQRRGHSAVVMGDSFYMFGGKDKQQKNDLVRYNFATKQFQVMDAEGELPRARHFQSMLTYNGCIYIFAGFENKLNMNDLFCYRIIEKKEVKKNSFEDQLMTLVNNPQFSDITFVVEGKKTFAHKNIICARSEHLKALVVGSMKESSQNEIELPEIKYQVFVAILYYLYTNTTKIEADYALELLVTADQMLLFDLKNWTEAWLCRAVSSENVLSLREFSLQYRTKLLFEKCEEYMAAANII